MKYIEFYNGQMAGTHYQKIKNKNVNLRVDGLYLEYKNHLEMSKIVEAVIVDKIQVNHDSYIFSFEFIDEKIHFTIGQHFRIHKQLPTFEHPQGEKLVKKYTPINPCSQTKKIDFLVKIYRPNVHPNFPNGGRYTPFLETQKIGDKLMIQGPFGRFDYKSGGLTSIDGQSLQFKKIFFIAGGSGITPIFQTILEIANMKDDKTELILLYANKTEADIVLRKQLQAHSSRIRLIYILDSPPQGWPFYKGFINHEMLKEICPLDDPNTLYIHCGPAPMNKFLRDLFASQYPNSRLFKF